MKTALSALAFSVILTACATTTEPIKTAENNPECAESFGAAYDVMADFRAALPKDQAEIKLTEYCITGNTPEALLSAMQTKGPSENPAGGTFFARTDWNVAWSYDYEIMDGLCHAKNIRTQLTVHYQMPVWRYDDSRDPALVDYWTRYIARLALHEIGHGDVGRRKAASIQDALAAHDSEDAACKDLGDTLNAIANRVITGENLDALYDKETGHGKTQGAFFLLKDARSHG